MNRRSLVELLSQGVRLFDTAARYKTELPLAAALQQRAAQVSREELFLTTKLWPGDVADVPATTTRPLLEGCEQVQAALNKSLSNLGTEYVDLYLVHWCF